MATKTVLITGAGIGIGRATAFAFAASGYHVAVTDVLEAGRREGRRRHPRQRRQRQFPSPRRHRYGGGERGGRRGRGGAGRARRRGGECRHRARAPLAELTDERWDRTFEVDLKGIFRVVRPRCRMAAPKEGAVVALSSIMGVAYGWDEHVHYSSAKSGVVGLVRGLAVELAGWYSRERRRARLRPNRPAAVGGAFARARRLEKAAEFIPLGRIGEPEDIADVIVFLASTPRAT